MTVAETPSRRPARRALALVGVLAVGGVAALSGCAGDADDPGEAAGELTVLASFYPLEFVAQRVGGDAVQVSSLTPAGAEPHDLELSPAQVRAVGEADVVLFLGGGFQPAVDDAIAARAPELLVDAADAARLDEGLDPHFWLDPTRLADVADQVATTLAEAEPADAGAFQANADALAADLAALDEEYAAGLATCESRTLVTTHDAFGYLAARYDLDTLPLSGLEPETEPSPARLREVGGQVEDRGVTTIFYETLVSPKVAEVLAADLDLETAVLDPVEGQTDEDQDYLGVMRANLEALRQALRCA